MDFLSTHPILVAAAALLLAIFTARLIRERWSQGGKNKRYAPLVGSVFHQLYYFSKVHHYHTDLAHKYKTYREHGVIRYLNYTVDPAVVEYILKTNFTNYGKGAFVHDNMKDLLGDGIFAIDGDKWRHQRKLASHEFSTKILRDFSSNVFRKTAARLAHVVSESAISKQSMDIQDLFMKSTLDSIFKVGFGAELDTLSGSSTEGTRFAKAFDDSSERTLWHFVDIFWKIKRALNIGSEAILKKQIKVIDDFVYSLIDQKIEQMSKQGIDSMKKEDILSRFLLEREKDPKNMTYRYLRDIILNFMIAGKDTTAGTLAWLFYMLCKYPDVQEKVAQDVKEATNTDTDATMSEFSSNLTEEALDKMQYLHAALTETLRLYPAVPEDPKICFSDDTLPDGSDVRKGDVVCYLPYSMGRMKFLWGEDAETYRPERWLNENGVFQPESPFKFTAFQAGPRICLGKEFAYRQMKIFAAVLIHFFTFKLTDEKREVEYRSMLTLQIDEGLHVQACRR